MSATVLSAVVNGAVLSLVLVAVLELVLRLLRNRLWNASTRFALWLAALCITITLPLVYLLVPFSPSMDSMQADTVSSLRSAEFEGNGPPVLPFPQGMSLPQVEQSRTLWDRFVSGIEIPPGPWAGWVLALWAAAGGLMLVRLPVSYAWLYRRRASAESTSLSLRAKAWMARCGSTRGVRVAVSQDVASPVAIGPFRPVILIPAKLIGNLREEQLEQIGLHEAAHLARWDDALLLIQRIVAAIFVLHPIVHWIAARLDIERELACDDAVVAATGQARTYAECLTRVAELANGLAGSPVAASAVENRTVLERRLDMLLDKSRKPGRHLFKARLAAVLPLTLLGFAITLAAPHWLAFARPPAVTVSPATVAGRVQAQSVPDSAKTEARENLNRGVEAFNSGDFDAAVNYFGRASQLDPGLTVASLYHATAYAAMYNPRAPETRDNSNRAIRILEDVLVKEPANVEAIVGLGVIYQLRRDLRPARVYFLKAASLQPPNATVFYSIGALNWLLLRDAMNPPTPAEATALIEEGLQYLDKALALNSRYVDAMTYKNLHLREKAKLAASPEEQDRLTAEADEWFQKSIQTRKDNLAQGAPSPTLPSVVGLAQQSGVPTAPPPAPPPPPLTSGGGLRPQDSPATVNIQVQRDGAQAGAAAPQRVGSSVAQANLIFRVDPAYPPLARAARIQGVVLLQVMISKEGAVRDLTVISGHPLLSSTALEAVKQWQYKPLLLNGQPVEILTTVTVNFTFSQ
jgi:TonB family protein